MGGWDYQLLVVGEVAVAMLLGGLIGAERQAADKPAGFRTHMLLAGASAALVGLAQGLLREFAAMPERELVRGDPIRIIEAVMTGISFLGAGTIFRNSKESHVEGLTTATSLIFSGGIGVAVGLRQFVFAAGVTVLALIVLRVLHWLEQRVERDAGTD